MAERYETSVENIMFELVECAVRDREGMRDSLLSGYFGPEEKRREEMKQRNPDDFEYLEETEQLLRDFARFSRNRNIGAV